MLPARWALSMMPANASKASPTAFAVSDGTAAPLLPGDKQRAQSGTSALCSPSADFDIVYADAKSEGSIPRTVARLEVK